MGNFECPSLLPHFLSRLLPSRGHHGFGIPVHHDFIWSLFETTSEGLGLEPKLNASTIRLKEYVFLGTRSLPIESALVLVSIKILLLWLKVACKYCSRCMRIRHHWTVSTCLEREQILYTVDLQCVFSSALLLLTVHPSRAGDPEEVKITFDVFLSSRHGHLDIWNKSRWPKRSILMSKLKQWHHT